MNQRTWDVICADINDNNPRFEPGALDKLGLPYSSDEDICFFDLGYCKQSREPSQT